MKKAEADFVLETNLNGIHHPCRAVVRSPVRARGGRIVDITSVGVRVIDAALNANGGVYM